MNYLEMNRRRFFLKLSQIGVGVSLMPWVNLYGQQSNNSTGNLPDPFLLNPGPWGFNFHKGAIILVSDQQLEDLTDPDREVDLSITTTPDKTTLRKVCQRHQSAGARTLILAFDHFWAQYRAGQGAKPRQLMPDTDAYIRHIQKISQVLEQYGMGLELSLLSPLELGPGYLQKTGEQGRWIQFREGLRDPGTGQFQVQLWEHQRWTNNKGSIQVKRNGVRAFAFRESRVGGSPYYAVNPTEMVEIKEPLVIEEWQGITANSGDSFTAKRLTVSGKGGPANGRLNRILVLVSYATPEMDYFSPKALPFLKDLIDRYHQAGVRLNGLYSDEMHIQQDWAYHSHHDEGQFTLRYLTPRLANTFSQQYGSEFADLDPYMVYFCSGQHGFTADLEAKVGAQHVFGAQPDAVQRTHLLRRRYYDLLSRTVVGLFTQAREYAEKLYGHELEARAHATWAQSPTIDRWNTGPRSHAPAQYEYTSNFVASNTVHQAASSCDDYFMWNDFLSGGGNDHTEGGWSDRNYYALALGCSTGILNRVPYAYAAHWGMPGPAAERRQALVDAYGAAASPYFQIVEDSEHRDIEVLILYPLSLVASDDRFGSWMVQYGYANYVTPAVLLKRGKIMDGGVIEMAGRRFSTLAVLFEPLPPAGLIPFMEEFVAKGGRLIWSGPPPRIDMEGKPVLAQWQKLMGVAGLGFGVTGWLVPGQMIRFEGDLKTVPTQYVLTDFIVDHIYPIQPESDKQIVARVGDSIVGCHSKHKEGGSTTYLGFRPRDDQAASLGYEVRTWYEILKTLGAYPASPRCPDGSDNPSVISRQTPYLCCRFPNGTVSIAAHYRHHVETWPGGFHRDAKQDAKIMEQNPLPSDALNLKDFWINGSKVSYQGNRIMAFRVNKEGQLLAFAGYKCQSIVVDGKEWKFADRPMDLLSWAPVHDKRRTPGGAILEIWVYGNGNLSIPAPQGLTKARLFTQGSRIDRAGQEWPVRVENGILHIEIKPNWPNRHLYVSV